MKEQANLYSAAVDEIEEMRSLEDKYNELTATVTQLKEDMNTQKIEHDETIKNLQNTHNEAIKNLRDELNGKMNMITAEINQIRPLLEKIMPICEINEKHGRISVLSASAECASEGCTFSRLVFRNKVLGLQPNN